ncbi:MAG: protein kinase [Planctomycetota bacterium]
MGSKKTRRESTSARLALVRPRAEEGVTRALGEEREVHDEALGRAAAMLVLPAEALPNSKVRRSFSRQLDAVKELSHPGLLRVLDGGTNDGNGRGYLIYEREEGRTLRELLAAEGPRPAAEAVALAVDVLNALAYAHHQGQLHGGLSADEVLVVEEGGRRRARLLAFGFQAVVGAERPSPQGELRVDPDYAAPEMVKNEPIDPRADVYSVGVLLFELLTGRHPIPAGGSDAQTRRLTERADALPAGAGGDEAEALRLRGALQRALEKDPAQRFSSARAFALALAGAPAEEPDPWAWGEAAPEGGTCAASGATIPPFSKRTWSRRDTDRPFRCRANGKDYAGAAHWDVRGLCSKAARHAPVPAREGPPPADVEVSRPAAEAKPAEAKPAEARPAEARPAEARPAEARPAEAKPAGAKPAEAKPAAGPAEDAASQPRRSRPLRPTDRKKALRALLLQDAGLDPDPEEPEEEEQQDEPAAAEPAPTPTKEPVAEAKEEDSEEDSDERIAKRNQSLKGRRLSESATTEVESAFLDAWADAKRQTAAATDRMKAIGTRRSPRPAASQRPAPSPEPEPQPEVAPPQAQPQSSEPAHVAPPATPASASTQAPERVLPLMPVPATPYGAPPRRAPAGDTLPLKLAVVALGAVVLFGAYRWKQDLRAAETKRTGLEEERDRAVKDRNRFETSWSEAQAKKAQADHDLTAASAQLRQAQGRVEDSQTKLASALQERDHARGQVEELEPRLQAQLAKAAKLEETSQQLERALRQSEADLTHAREETRQRATELQQREAKAQALGAELAAAEAKAQGLSAELRQSEAKAQGLSAELRQSEAKAQGLSADLQAARTEQGRQAQELTALRTKLGTSEAARAELARRSARLESELATAQGVARGAQQELAQAQELATKAQVEAKELRGKQEELEVELEDTRVERDQLDLEALELEGWLRDTDRDLRQARAELERGRTLTLAARGLDAQGQVQDQALLRAGERSALVSLPLADLRPWLERAQEGRALLALHLEGPSLSAVRGQVLAAAGGAPAEGGREQKLEDLGQGHYRLWLDAEDAKSYLSLASLGQQDAQLVFVLHAGERGGALTRAELVISELTPDAQARLRAGRSAPLR